MTQSLSAFGRNTGLVALTTAYKDLSHVRTVGLFKSMEDAEQVLAENMGDLAEAGYYSYAVVECIEWGLYPEVVKERWWVHDHCNNKWDAIVGRPAVVEELEEQQAAQFAGFSQIG